jgi:hypothetical protein
VTRSRLPWCDAYIFSANFSEKVDKNEQRGN